MMIHIYAVLDATNRWASGVLFSAQDKTVCVLHTCTLGHINFGIHRVIVFFFLCVFGRNPVAHRSVGTKDPWRRAFSERLPGQYIYIYL